MGVGITGSRQLVDHFHVTTEVGLGTEITLRKNLPKNAGRLDQRKIGALGEQLAAMPSDASFSEVQQQYKELLSTLAELAARQDELLVLSRELTDTNRGRVALHAELDEKADRLRHAEDMKSRFLANMSHEFRTPLSSIRALAKLLLDRVDGELNDEQEKQVAFILQGALGLNELVNDLLDVAKIEAGRVDVRPARFEVADMFSALRGMMRPLLADKQVSLNFVEPESGCRMVTDEAKLSQILRNFISNAVKFTEAGTITISASILPADGVVKFSVADTGLGIAAADLELIFEEFSQVENRLQVGVKGTGLGLALCRTLAGLLNGHVTVESTLGTGSVFSVLLPMVYVGRADPGADAVIDRRIPASGGGQALAPTAVRTSTLDQASP